MKQFNGPAKQLGFGLLGASILSGVIGAFGAKKAADKQVKGAREAQAATERMTAPYRAAGEAVLDPLTQLAIQGPESELTRAEGFRGIQNSAAASGKLHSGGALAELVKFNNQLNEQNFDNRFNALFNLARLGSNAATNQATNSGNLITGAANAGAAGIAGIANAGTNALNNFAFLDYLKNKGASQPPGYSDVRLKTNIKRIGEVNGLNIYEWDWNAEGIRLGNIGKGVGVLAQEIDPAFVSERNGYLQVDYGRLF